MLMEFTRDHAFNLAILSFMTMVWFGWAQEDPPRHWRWRLGAGAGIGVVLAGLFGYTVSVHWEGPSALERHAMLFNFVFLGEMVIASLGVLFLWRKRRMRWAAWWVALVVALHFLPLAYVFDDIMLGVLGLVQAALLALLVPRLRAEQEMIASRLVGPVMGLSMLAFVLVSAAVFVAKEGALW